MRRRNSSLCSEDGPPRKKICDTCPIPTIDIKPGEILTDLTGKQWKLGKAVGMGGFGEIFLAYDADKETDSHSQYVAKVETHTNGPLFVEINCYLRIAKKEKVEEWKEKMRLERLGMPIYIASGSHQTKDSKLRFLVIPRFDKDLEQIFQSKKRKFNLKTVLIIATQLLDTLEYIHNNGYVHSDIKASNILLQSAKKDKITKSTVIRYAGTVPLRSCRVKKLMIPRLLRPNGNVKFYDITDEKTTTKNVDQVFLLDYGLASKYILSSGEHKEFCSDERKAHAGTILFCSLDAHKGAQSRRSDLESLGYNMVYWLTSKLPWLDDTDEPHVVQKKKQKCLMNLDEFLKLCFLNGYPKFLYDYFKYLGELEFDAEPDYEYCRRLFQEALKEYGYKDSSKFDFDNLEGWGKKQKKTKASFENKKSPRISYKLNRIPLTSNLPVKPELRKKRKNKKINKLNWSKILIDPEIIIKQGKTRDRKSTESSDCGANVLNLDIDLLNPTYAMLEVYNKSIERANSGSSPRYKGDSGPVYIEGYTPAMMAVYNRKKEREELELEKMVANARKSSRLTCKKTGRSKKIEQNLQISKTRHTKSVSDIRSDTVKKPKPSYRLRG